MTYGAVLGAMVLLTSVVLITVSHYNARENMLDVSRTFVGQVTDVTYQRTAAFLDEPRIVNHTTVRDLRNGLIGLERPHGMETYFYDTLLVHGGVHLMNYADTQGNFLMVKRMPDGSMSTKSIRIEMVEQPPNGDGTQPQPIPRRITEWVHRHAGDDIEAVKERMLDPDDSYDPRERPWFIGARQANELFWTDAYIFYTDKAPGITVSIPYVIDGDFRGVTSVDIGLADFSRFLSELQIGDRGSAFIIDHRGNLIASPDPSDLVAEAPDGGSDLTLHKAQESTVPALAAISALPVFKRAMDETAEGTFSTMHFESEGEYWLGAVQPIRVAPGKEWLIVVVAPEDDFLAQIKTHNQVNLVVAVVFVFLALILSALLSRWISSSLRLLVDESRKIEELNFDQPSEIKTQFREIHDVLAAFEGMKTGLRAFQKYMPLKLVRILLESQAEPELASENKVITIWFSDIAGFSAVAERLEPQEMSVALGHYLGDITKVIEGRDGTVVQYVGDEIFALFNAPLPVDQHPLKACEAVIEARNLVASMYDGEGGTVPLPTRFALHTTEVAVGHFGSPERLYYGAVGDGVNLTSRLEGANKQYGTDIIISEDVWRQVADHFESRRLDTIIVKGRTTEIGIYELLGRKGEVDADLLAARTHYEDALALYAHMDWDDAIEACKKALEIRKDDRAARMLATRCRKYKRRGEVETGWTAAFKMETK